VLSPTRAYDVAAGRWLSEDPANLSDGLNRYAYTRNNPTTNIDPDGRVSVTVHIGQIQRISEYGELLRMCHASATGGTTWGCTPVSINADCDCSLQNCKWRASAWFEAKIKAIYVLDNPRAKHSAEEIIREEMKHVQYFLDTVEERKKAGEELESREFSSRFACKLGLRAVGRRHLLCVLGRSDTLHKSASTLRCQFAGRGNMPFTSRGLAAQTGRTFRTAVLTIAIAVAMSAACEQPVVLPSRGAAEADVRRLLGDPSRIEKRPDDDPEGYASTLPSCSRDAVKNVEAAWIYERRPYKDVVVVFDKAGKVLCAGHGGMTFVQ
jgi:hypothetical protein